MIGRFALFDNRGAVPVPIAVIVAVAVTYVTPPPTGPTPTPTPISSARAGVAIAVTAATIKTYFIALSLVPVREQSQAPKSVPGRELNCAGTCCLRRMSVQKAFIINSVSALVSARPDKWGVNRLANLICPLIGAQFRSVADCPTVIARPARRGHPAAAVGRLVESPSVFTFTVTSIPSSSSASPQ